MSTIVGKGMDKRFSQAELMGEIWGFPMSCHVLWIPGRLMTVSPATFCSYSGRLAVITSRPPHNVLELGSADNSKNIFMDLLFISPGREVRYDPRCSPFRVALDWTLAMLSLSTKTLKSFVICVSPTKPKDAISFMRLLTNQNETKIWTANF